MSLQLNFIGSSHVQNVPGEQVWHETLSVGPYSTTASQPRKSFCTNNVPQPFGLNTLGSVLTNGKHLFATMVCNLLKLWAA